MSSKEEREVIGKISVDSGVLLITDPAYLGGIGLDDEERLQLSPGALRFDELPEPGRRSAHTQKLREKAEQEERQRFAPVLGDLALSLLPGCGDGEYEVAVTRNEKGLLAKLEITFLEEKGEKNKE